MRQSAAVKERVDATAAALGCRRKADEPQAIFLPAFFFPFAHLMLACRLRSCGGCLCPCWPERSTGTRA